MPVSDVPLEVSLGRRHLEHLVEPALKVLRRRRRAVDVDPASAETGTLQLKFDVVVFRVRVGNAHRLAFAQWEEAVPPVEHKDAIVLPVEVDLAATLEGGPEDQLATFERVFQNRSIAVRPLATAGAIRVANTTGRTAESTWRVLQDWPKLSPARQRHRWGDCEREAAGQHQPQPPGPVAQHRCSVPSIVAVPSLDHVNTVSMCCSFVSRQAVGRSEVAQRRRRRRQRERRASGSG